MLGLCNTLKFAVTLLGKKPKLLAAVLTAATVNVPSAAASSNVSIRVIGVPTNTEAAISLVTLNAA